MDGPPLVARLQALAERKHGFDAALQDAHRLAQSDPAAGLARIRALLPQSEPIEAEEDACLALMGGFGAAQRPLARQHWQDLRATSLVTACFALTLLDRPVELAEAIAAARAAAPPGSPNAATVAELEASLPGHAAQTQTLLDEGFDALRAAGQWVHAVQNRMRAAALAGLAGQNAVQQARLTQAIDLARGRGLALLAIECRITRFRTLLLNDLSGAVLDELRTELDFRRRPAGNLPTDLDRESAEAMSTVAAAFAADRAALPDALHAAAAAASGFMLAVEAGGLARLAATATAAPAEAAPLLAAVLVGLHRTRARLCTDLLLLAADFKQRLADPDTALEALDQAERVAAPVTQSLVAVLMAKASLLDGVGQAEDALAAAEAAVGHAATLAAVPLQRQAAAQRDELGRRLGRPPAPAPDPAALRVAEATEALRAGRPKDALVLVDSVRPGPEEWQGELLQSLLRAAARFELGELPAASAALAAALAVFGAAGPDAEPARLDARPVEREIAGHMLAAVQAESGQPAEAWTTAEASRTPGGPPLAWPTMRDWLARERAALLTVAPLHWGTLVTLAGPDDAEPHAELFRGFAARDMKRLLAPGMPVDSPVWNSLVFDAVDELSHRLVGPLAPALAAATAAARVLYVIPFDAMMLAPFAALRLSAGLPLAQLCPLAVAGSAAQLLRAGSAGPAGPPATCLAVAAGRDTAGFDFAGHLAPVCAAGWRQPPERLQGAEATIPRVAAAAAGKDLLYVSAHGSLSATVQDAAQASRLALSGGAVLTAGAMAAWPALPRRVFLNACQSARFRAPRRAALGGFPGALLDAGCRSVVACLTHVDPEAAGQLAAAYTASCCAGAPPGAALQSAQRRLREAGRPASDWAAHVLFGYVG